MSAAAMTARFEESSPRFKARMAGLFWLMTIVTGAFALITNQRLIVSGDAVATAANILAHESLYRMAFTSNLMATLCYVAVTLLVYELLEPVNRTLSLLAAFFGLVGCAIGAFSIVFNRALLVILGGAQYLNVFTTDQLKALALTSLRVGIQTDSISNLFFGLHCGLIGYLILKSAFLPRFVGVLMVFAGAGWLTNGFAGLLYPPLARALFPYIILPGLLGEASLTLWFLVVGVNAARWREQAG